MTENTSTQPKQNNYEMIKDELYLIRKTIEELTHEIFDLQELTASALSRFMDRKENFPYPAEP